MYTEPVAVNSTNLAKRCYVEFYFQGERVREYNGKRLGKKISPNYAKTVEERKRLLLELSYELKAALKNNTYQTKPEKPKPVQMNAGDLLTDVLEKKLKTDLSPEYKRDLKTVLREFLKFLTEDERKQQISEINTARVEDFLNQFSSSGTYYMNKRRALGVLFSKAGKSLQINLTVVKDTDRRRAKAKLHTIYEKHQIKPILSFLKTYHNNLYLCCIITYGCLLRPHKEVRNLLAKHFKKGVTEIHLSGNENKGKSVRVVYVPKYVQDELFTRVQSLKTEFNIFSLFETPYNESYFNTAWTRAWKLLYKQGLIEKNQTIYSFRHTAAVDVYRRTKDVYLLQKLLGHSSIVVTLKYLRGLGEISLSEMKDAAPEL